MTGDFMWHMEDMLTRYEPPDDPRQPVVCVDERPCQLMDEVLAPLPMKPGRTTRQDDEDVRQGTCGVWLAFEPLGNWRFVQVRMRRTAMDYVSFMPELSDTHDRGSERIRLVQDHRNTHTPGSFYQAFAPPEAVDLAQKFARHDTPIQGSWLNMAEIELSALARQCLDRRIGTIDTFKKEVTCWTDHRNHVCTTVQWKFTTTEACQKLNRKYPMLQD
jgi:DDE superfamily endonuclease